MNYPTSADDGGSAPGVDGRATRWASHREERRAELVHAARRAVHQLGPQAPMEDIAAAARTSKSVFYRYFRDKAGLQAAMGSLVLLQMQERIAEAAAAAQTPYEGLRSMIGAYLGMAVRSPNVYEFVTRVPQDAASEGDQAFGSFFDAIGAMIQTPMTRFLDPEATATITYWPTAAIGLVRSAGERWLADPESPGKPSLEAMAGMITDWLVAGVAAQATSFPDPRLTPATPVRPSALPPAKEHS